MPNVIGMSAYFHDSACCILKDGQLVAAAQEERFSRKKHDSSLPVHTFRYCLREAGLTLDDIDCIAYYENPVKKADRQLRTRLAQQPKRDPPAIEARLPESEIRDLLGYTGPIEYVDHHESHAASSFYFSGFNEAAVLTVDGVGEWTTTAYGQGQGDDLWIIDQVLFPHSLGLLYSTITAYLGFPVNDGEYKVMGLAPYGAPVYEDRIRCLVQSRERGQYRLDLKYFDFRQSQRMFTDALPALFGRPARLGTSIEAFHCDVAQSLQRVIEAILVEKSRYLFSLVGSNNLCMAGGVALNCVANSKVLRNGPFRRLFVQPAANDAGGAVGAAAIVHKRLTGRRPAARGLKHVCLGPAFPLRDVQQLLTATGLQVRDYSDSESGLLSAVAARIAQGKVVGWFQGRMEFGPRSLGARSILGDPRDPDLRERLNRLVKKREVFRPFAPAVLESAAAEHFDIDHPSPFMLLTFAVISKLHLPAITHVDGSARVQTVDPRTMPRFAGLLREFERQTGCPILLNTSFNVRDEPIVCTPADALACFIRAGLDCLAVEDFLIDRSSLPPELPHLIEDLVPLEKSSISQNVYAM